MNLFKKLISYSLLLSLPTLSFAGNIRGIPTLDTHEIFENGGLILVSQKANTILMYNTTPKANDYCNFFVEITNESPDFETFYFDELVVTDQWGRKIPVKKKKTVIKNKEKMHFWENFFQAVVTSAEIADANKNAGKVKYTETTVTNAHANVNARVENRRDQIQGHVIPNQRGRVQTSVVSTQRDISQANANIHVQSREEVKGEYVDEFARQEQLRRLHERQVIRAAQINHAQATSIHNAENFYLDNHTLKPGETYGANFQILIPKELKKDLQEIIISYYFAGEEYNFLYRVK